PTILSINGASAALTISNIPFQGPVGAVRMGYIEGQLVVNPPMADMERSDLDLAVAGTEDAILMVEAGAKGVTEDLVLQALDRAHEAIRELCRLQNDLRAEAGVPKTEVAAPQFPEAVSNAVAEWVAQRLDGALYNPDKAG